MSDFSDFLADRRRALLSMDKPMIEAYMLKYGVRVPENEQTFWMSVHMARTGAKDLPMGARVSSKAWLTARGFRSMDEGELG